VPERGLIAEFGIELTVIDDVVAMGAAGSRLQVRRQIGVTDAQGLQIGRQLRHLIEAEATMQL
jgi:hypothetical protein